MKRSLFRSLAISRPQRGDSPPQARGASAASASTETNVQALQKRLSERQTMLTKSIEGSNRELLRLKQEMAATKVGSTSHKRYKERALRVVKQKRSLEKRLEVTVDQLYNVAQMSDSQHVARDAKHYAAVMGISEEPLLDVDGVTVDEASETVEAMREKVREIEEVGVMLGQPFGMDVMGDEEIMEEIDELYEKEVLGKGLEGVKGFDFEIPDPPTDMPQPPSLGHGRKDGSSLNRNSRRVHRR